MGGGMTSYTKYPKGSKWRKWDLHVHTPATKLSDGYNVKGGEDVWDKFCDIIESSDVEALGITDYFSAENYFTFIKKHKNKYPDSPKRFFPNVEFRLEVSVNKAAEEVNLHIIFDNGIPKNKIDSFLSKLNTNISRNGANVSCKDLSDQKDFKGAGIDYKNLRKTLKEVFGEDECYLIFAASNNSGLRPDNRSPRKLNITDEIDKICDGFFGGQQNIDYYLNVDRYENDELAKRKPVINGCDAHSFSELENWLGKQATKTINGEEITEKDITWIKSDPTFEGLKQIIYEPDGRVKIQREKPEEKMPYTVIDAVRFVDSRTKKEFSDSWIELNPNLNSIIGGKSSGKSILLYHIAKTIDRNRIEEINKDSKYKTLNYDFEEDDKFDFEVKWSDGTVCKLKDRDNPNRPITYIPQLYLNRLAEDQKDELNSLVDKMLVESSDEYKEFRSTIKRDLDAIKTDMLNVIDGYYKTKERLKEKREELKELGDKKAITENITRIKEKIDNLRKESSFSEEEETKYKTLTDDIATLKVKQTEIKTLIKVLTSTKDSYKAFKSEIATLFQQQVESTINSQFPALSGEISKTVSGIVGKTVSKLQKVLDVEIQTRFSVIDDEQKRLNELNKKAEEKSEKLKPLAEKVKNKTVFSQLQKKLESESAKVILITEKETEIRKLEESLSTENIEDTYRNLFSAYQHIVKENEKYRIIPDADNLELSSRIKIDAEKFRENFVQKINKKRALNQQLGDYFDAENEYLYDQTTHLDNIDSMIRKITTGEVTYNSGYDEKHAMLSLLDDYFSIDYDLLKDGDDLIKMSPGKRGIILFQLFLHLSKSENPILIDQPEDNLDNRTVYQELNEFIKTKKSTRQIIIVSHNPNLVVSTDSENIIVANQAGQDKSGKNFNYKFEYVNGAIEHSFIETNQTGVLFQRGIRQHVCDILEGGEEAFAKRENKYGFN
jgi:predicted ATPase